MNKFFSILTIIVGIFCEYTNAQSGTKMHRVQDTTKDKSGLYYAKSTEGSFSALLPVPFNDFTITENDAKTGIIKVYMIGSKTQEGIKFSISEMPFIKKPINPNLDDFLKGFQKPENIITNIKRENYKNFPSIFFFVEGKTNGAYFKYINTSKSLITMIIEFPLEYKTTIETYTNTFFTSLKIKDLK
jgi:hypothetical protein